MSTVSNNKKFVELDGVRIFHDKKDNTISIISTDEDLVGKPFKITLNRGTDSEVTIRELLRDSGVISKEMFFYDPLWALAAIPKLAKKPDYYLTNWSKDILPIGVNQDSNRVEIDLSSSPHTLIVGGTGSGKTHFIENMKAHLSKGDLWDLQVLAKHGYSQSADIKKIENIKNRIMEAEAYSKPNMVIIENLFELFHNEENSLRETLINHLNIILEAGEKNNVYLTVAAQRMDFCDELDLNLFTNNVMFGKVPSELDNNFYVHRDRMFSRPGLASIQSDGLRIADKLTSDLTLVQNYIFKA